MFCAGEMVPNKPSRLYFYSQNVLKAKNNKNDSKSTNPKGNSKTNAYNSKSVGFDTLPAAPEEDDEEYGLED